MTDQQRGDTVRPGHPCLTPNLDRFRARAVDFSGTFCPSPHCCPSRATFFTGLLPSEHGVWNNVEVPNAFSTDLKPGVRLWSEELAAAGYDCEFVGKWHVSFDRGPADFGWRDRRGQGHGGAPRSHRDISGDLWRDYARQAALPPRSNSRAEGEILRPGWSDYVHYGEHENPFNDQGVTDRARAILSSKTADSAPWCLYCGTLGPHDPYFVPRAFLDLYRDIEIPLPPNFEDTMEDKPALYRRTRGFFDQLSPEEHRGAIRHYRAFCTYEDHLFGQLLEALEAGGHAENTLVIYCSDHGDYAGEHGLWCKGLPCFRGAYHVPLLIAGPGVRGGRSVPEMVSLADIAPTLLELTGTGAEFRHSGRSLVPWLRGETPSAWRSALFTQSNGNEQYGIQRSITTGQWKYVHNGFDFDELYDLKNDPHEQHNLAGEKRCEGIVRELCARIWRFAREHDDPCTNPYIMVGMAPAGPAEGLRDGVVSGW
ncbi:MAG: sulfatase-like hydrolase/transferase [Verrucomicrobia bacterium]|nr:sulfatase-like hydrolase/transferase [Verrucomicrobiota bacterium]